MKKKLLPTGRRPPFPGERPKPVRYFYALKGSLEKGWFRYDTLGGDGVWTKDLGEARLMDGADCWSPRKGEKVVRIEATLREVDDGETLYNLCVEQAAILTEVANALRGDPPELTHWSHHDLAQRARDVMDENKRLREALKLIKVAEHKGHPIAYATAIANAMDNLGVPQPGYPAPVAGAYRILESALRGEEAR